MRERNVVLTLVAVWFAAAAIVGLSGVYEGARTPVIGGSNAALVVLSLLAIWLVPAIREGVRAIPLRWLILFHLTRFVGIAFLVMHANGVIPSEFAITAGWGDIAVAVLALVVAFALVPIRSRGSWWAVLAWNVFGLVDILYVLRTGIGLGLADPAQMTWITRFPMSLVPTFIVPLVLVTHVLIFVRLWHSPVCPWAAADEAHFDAPPPGAEDGPVAGPDAGAGSPAEADGPA
ncbi:MAG TPA: hypothetical protein VK837_14760 [Longimicrobiales bacterium]|nr:hypothetical protein [Longimicrobiales bacterium]